MVIEINRFTVPALNPFQKVIWAGLIPLMRAVKWLSIAQQKQADATRKPAYNPAVSSPFARIAAATSMMMNEYHPDALKWSRNKSIPSNAVATSSKFNQRDTDAAGDILKPKRKRTGPDIPPKKIDPDKRNPDFLSIFHGQENTFCLNRKGNTPNDAPR